MKKDMTSRAERLSQTGRIRQICPRVYSHRVGRKIMQTHLLSRLFEKAASGSSGLPVPSNRPLTWSAKDVDSMPMSSLSAVSLHICSHFILRSLSRSSRITPGRQHRRERNSSKTESQAHLSTGAGGEHAWVQSQALPVTQCET